MAWLACRHLVHLLSASGFVCTQEKSVGQGVKGGSEWDTATRLLVPTHFAKVEQSISPVVDYLQIELAEESGVSILPNP